MLTVDSLPPSVGMNFGIQIAWVVLNIGTITLFSIIVSKRYLNQYQKLQGISKSAEEKHEVASV